MRWSFGSGFLAAMLLPIAACRTQVDVEAGDNSVFFPVVRAVWALDQGENRPERTGEVGAEAEPDLMPAGIGWSLEVDVAGGRGEDVQTITGSEVIHVGDTSFLGPTSVQVQWDLYVATLAARARIPLGGNFSIDGLGGLGIDHLRIRLSDAGNVEKETSTTVGPFLGARINWQASKLLGVYGQFNGFLGVGDATATQTGLDLALTVRPVRSFMLFGGWRTWVYREDRFGSDFELAMSGPMAGLQFDF